MNERNPRTLGQPLQLRAVICPSLASIQGVLQSTVVRTHPQFPERISKDNAQNGAVVFSLGRINREPTTGRLIQLFKIVGGQVRLKVFMTAPDQGCDAP